MNAKKLKELLANVPDDMQVLIPANPKDGFDGLFFSPCAVESGEIEMGGDETVTDEEIEKAINLGTLKGEKSFVLVPCGFYEEHDTTHEMN